MTLLPLFNWCQETWLAQIVRNSPVYSPIVDVVHLFGLVLVFGSVLLINLRLSGAILQEQRVAELAQVLWPWWKRGLAISAASGVVFFLGSAIKMYSNAPFYFKMAALAIALTFQTTVHRRLVESGGIDRARVVAAVSTALWAAVPFFGFWIELF
jgi:hypothetical protein